MTSRERAAGYIRVSSDDQVEGYSLDAQRNEIARYCERHGFELVQIYADEGVSAHTDSVESRPQLVALLDDAGQRQFDVVVVHTIDRWARNVGVQRDTLRRLGASNVGFASVSENIDFTTPAGKLMLTMIGAVSEFFSDQLAVHVSKAVRERAEQGLPVGGIPFAYITHEAGEVPTLVPHEAEAVREAFRRRARGESYGSIARWLNMEGFETRGRSEVFTSFAVKDMLGCRFYRGIVTYKGTEYTGKHEAVIDEELFERVQARRGAPRQQRSLARGRGILQGKLSCGRCGSALHSDRDHRGRPMYRERHGKQGHTNTRSVMAEVVDKQLEDIWMSLEFAPDWRERMTELAASAYTGPGPEELGQQRRRLARAYADGGLSDAEYEARVKEIDERVQRAAKPVGPSFEEAASYFADMGRFWRRANTEERRRLMSPLVDRAYLDVEGKRLAAIKPTSEFRLLIEHALQLTPEPQVVLIPPGTVDEVDIWRWWRRGGPELQDIQTPTPETADEVNSWRWWRRGRIELPVQSTPSTDIYGCSHNGLFLPAPIRWRLRADPASLRWSFVRRP